MACGAEKTEVDGAVWRIREEEVGGCSIVGGGGIGCVLYYWRKIWYGNRFLAKWSCENGSMF